MSTDVVVRPRPALFWLADQCSLPDVPPLERAAARHLVERFSNLRLTFRDLVATLVAEDSSHLAAARRLAGRYYQQWPEPATENDLKVLGLQVRWSDAEAAHCVLCTRLAVPGTDRCPRHGGALITPEDRQAVSTYLTDRLTSMADRALGVLSDLMDNARSEKVRLDAAVAVLDRSGIASQTMRHQVILPDEDESRRVLSDRLEQLREALVIPAMEIVEGQVG